MIFPHKDKADHFVYWFFGTSMLLKAAELMSIANKIEIVLTIAVLAAIAKEVRDGDRNTRKEHILDASAGTLGAITALLIGV